MSSLTSIINFKHFYSFLVSYSKIPTQYFYYVHIQFCGSGFIHKEYIMSPLTSIINLKHFYSFLVSYSKIPTQYFYYVHIQDAGSARDIFCGSCFIHKEYIVTPLTSIINLKHFYSFLASYSKIPTQYFYYVHIQDGGLARDIFCGWGFIHKEYIISPLTSIINFRHFLSFLASYSKIPTQYFYYVHIPDAGSAHDIFCGSGFIHKEYIMSPLISIINLKHFYSFLVSYSKIPTQYFYYVHIQDGGLARDIFCGWGFIHKEYIISPLTSIINFRHFLSFLASYSKIPTQYFYFKRLLPGPVDTLNPVRNHLT